MGSVSWTLVEGNLMLLRQIARYVLFRALRGGCGTSIMETAFDEDRVGTPATLSRLMTPPVVVQVDRRRFGGGCVDESAMPCSLRHPPSTDIGAIIK